MRELSLQNSRLDRYDILELLGRGSYAEVFVARDRAATLDSPHSKVVIKALNVFLQNDLDEELERTLVQNFQNEALALDRVRHPNVVSRLGHGTARDMRGTVFHYLVLEYLPGGDLAQASRGKRIEADTAFGYIEQVAAGLSHAHSNGVIHRDIKPQNLLLSGDGRTVKIADFGVARFAGSDAPITRVGTNIYAAPEHNPLSAAGGRSGHGSELTPAADVYSLAKSCYALLTGESPRVFANGAITSLPVSVADEPWADGVLRVLQRATSETPDARHQSVGEFWNDMARARNLTRSEAKPAIVSPSPRAHVTRGYNPKAPERPEFTPGAVPGARHMLPALAASRMQPIDNQALQDDGPADLFTDYGDVPARATVRRKLGRATVAVLILSIFVGLLYGTHLALRGSDLLSGMSWFQPTATVTADVNLRSEAAAASRKIGTVPRNSRVRIVNSKDNWYEIVVIDYSRPKDSPGDPSQGWISARYVDLDGN